VAMFRNEVLQHVSMTTYRDVLYFKGVRYVVLFTIEET